MNFCYILSPVLRFFKYNLIENFNIILGAFERSFHHSVKWAKLPCNYLFHELFRGPEPSSSPALEFLHQIGPGKAREFSKGNIFLPCLYRIKWPCWLMLKQGSGAWHLCSQLTFRNVNLDSHCVANFFNKEIRNIQWVLQLRGSILKPKK